MERKEEFFWKNTHANWQKDGLDYLLMSYDDEMSSDEFFEMAEEIIEQ